MLYEIWAEGYQVTGQFSGATKLGKAHGNTFREAVFEFARQNPEYAKYINQEGTHYWGCQLFSNEADARMSYG